MKNYLLFFAFILSVPLFSQEAYFHSGKNLTNYDFKVGAGESSSLLQSGNGNFYEIGLIKPFVGNHIFYSAGISLNEYNAIGSTSANSYRWNTEYLGLTGELIYSFFPKHRSSLANSEKKSDSEKDSGSEKIGNSGKKNKSSKKYSSNAFKNFDVLFNLGINGSTIIQGKQEIDGVFYDLMDQQEFSGILLGSHAGFKFKYRVSNSTSCSVGYNFFQSINLTNKTEEKLSFNTNQVQFGLYFNIN